MDLIKIIKTRVVWQAKIENLDLRTYGFHKYFLVVIGV